jgi:hypothetical protein
LSSSSGHPPTTERCSSAAPGTIASGLAARFGSVTELIGFVQQVLAAQAGSRAVT